MISLALLPLLLLAPPSEAVMLKTFKYNVKGDVKVVGEKVIVENFSYNNGAPDAFFYIGTSGCPSGSGTLLQYPAGAADRPLGPYTGQTVELPLPAGVSAAEVAWVSVWCRQYSLDLGHAIIATDGECSGSGRTVISWVLAVALTLAVILLVA